MSELKVSSCFEFEKVLRGKSNKLFYPKSEVDAAIAELKAENRRLQRALWLARAERAKWESLYYWYAISNKFKSRKFDEVERKCRAKAEEYK